jgi:hypothetical protein
VEIKIWPSSVYIAAAPAHFLPEKRQVKKSMAERRDYPSSRREARDLSRNSGAGVANVGGVIGTS